MRALAKTNPRDSGVPVAPGPVIPSDKTGVRARSVQTPGDQALVTTAHRLSLVLALGIVNLVLAGIALSLGLTRLG